MQAGTDPCLSGPKVMSDAIKPKGVIFASRNLEWKRLAEYIIVLAIVLESAVFVIIAPQFFSLPNLINVALSIAITGILAVGMTALILTGGIDLSVGSVAALAGVVAAMIASSGRVLAASLVALGIA